MATILGDFGNGRVARERARRLIARRLLPTRDESEKFLGKHLAEGRSEIGYSGGVDDRVAKRVEIVDAFEGDDEVRRGARGTPVADELHDEERTPRDHEEHDQDENRARHLKFALD